MIRRIVKMTFREEEVPAFAALFEQTKDRLRHFPGCKHLELWRQHDQHSVFFTFSIWDSPEDLAQYRSSDLFAQTWKQTKALFAAPPQAWSLDLFSQPEQVSGISL